MWKAILFRLTDYGITNLIDRTGASLYVHVGYFSDSFDC